VSERFSQVLKKKLFDDSVTNLSPFSFQCTKNKTWKDIAAQLGIGASSSGAYTLKKHYGKNLLPYECKFDRGGIDPTPLLAQVEAGTKKAKKVPSSVSQPPPAPSPGSQDSRDSSFGPNSVEGNPPIGAPPGSHPSGGPGSGYPNSGPYPHPGPPNVPTGDGPMPPRPPGPPSSGKTRRSANDTYARSTAAVAG
jgi:AT-rich interactive domain-containing protein 1